MDHSFLYQLVYMLLFLLIINGQKLAESETVRTELNICWIWEEDSYYGPYQRIAAAVDLAIDHMNSFVLPDHLKVKSTYQSSGRSCTKTMYSVVDQVTVLLYKKGVTCNLFLGAGCSYTAGALYGFAHRRNIPILGVPAVGWWSVQPSADYKDFALGVVATFGYSDTTTFLSQFLRLKKYTDLTLLRDESYDYYAVMAEAVMRFMRTSNPTVFHNTTVKVFASKSATNDTYRQLLQSANERSRIVLLMIHGDAVRQLMIAASELGFTQGEHVFIAFELFESLYWGKISPLKEDSYDQVAVEAFRSLLLISFDDGLKTYSKAFDREVKVAAGTNYNYTFDPLEKLDPIVVGHYECIVVYMKAVMSLLADGLDITNGSLVVSRVTGSSYEAFRGIPVYVNSNRQRDKNYDIKMFDRRSGDFETYIEFQPHSAANVTFRQIKQIIWPNPSGAFPPNEPKCGFRNNKCIEEGLSASNLAVAITVPFLFILLVSTGAIFMFYKMWKIKGALNPDWWKINLDRLDVHSVTDSSNSKRSLGSQTTADTLYSSSSNKTIAVYRAEAVALVTVALQPAKNDLIDELNLVKSVENNNLQRIFGIGLDSQGICHYIVCEPCLKGSLSDILENEMVKLDWFFKNSLIRDTVHGMAYLHSSPIGSHGNLSANTCFIDVRFTLKISDYGLPFFRTKDFVQPLKNGVEERDLTPLLWRAPELLRQIMPLKGTQKGDVYSFAIILQQIILRSAPFELPGEPLEMSPKEILIEVMGDNIPPVRPRVPRSACSNELYDLMERCWEEVPLERPAFAKTKDRLRKIVGNIGDNLVDLLLKRMEQYASDLEKKVAEQTQQFMDEKNRSEQLLSQLLPKSIAASLTKGISVEPESFESVTIFFSDIVDFTTISVKGSPMDVVDLLNSLYTFFDSTLEKYDVYKVETIGDAYMVASGLPLRNGNKHAAEIANMAINLQHNIGQFVVPNMPNEKVQIRAGINSAGMVHISEFTKRLLDSHGGFLIIERGEISVKGKGSMLTHWLLGA